LVGVVFARTFVVLSQFLKRNVQDTRLLAVQLQTVIQRLPMGPPCTWFAVIVKSNVQVDPPTDPMLIPPKSVL